MSWPSALQFLASRGRSPQALTHATEGCDCGTHLVVSDGFEVCTGCGLCVRPVFEEDCCVIPDRQHTQIMQRYDYMTHLEARLSTVKKEIAFAVYNRIIKVFPYVYQSFFIIARGRKNFMSYPYVIGKLIEAAGVDISQLKLKAIKTPCKVREAEYYWAKILEITPQIREIMWR